MSGPYPFRITDETIVLASINPPSVWNFYGSEEIARQHQEDANGYNVRLETHGAPKRFYAPMKYGEYKAQERGLYLNRPEERITRETFDEMLNVLPPKNVRGVKGGGMSFLMIEHWSGPYTQQFIQRGQGDEAAYFSKLVDAEDESTWMK